MFNKNYFKKNLKLIDKIAKKKFSQGSFDIEYNKGKKFFVSPPYQYYSLNFFEEIYKDRNNYIAGNINMIIDNLLKFQNKDGSFDEWYRFERSFCSTSYTSFILSEFLINNKKKITHETFDKIYNSLLRSFEFLKKKQNKLILNQNFAKLSFLQNLNKIIELKNKTVVKKEIFHFEKYIKNKIFNSYDYEYGGIDLGYLTITISLAAKIYTESPTNLNLNNLRHLVLVFKKVTFGFNSISNFIFARSSRVILISGFYISLKLGLITQKEFQNIFDEYKKSIDFFLQDNDFRYLSFFYSTDIYLIYKTNKTLIKKPKNIPKNKIKINFKEIIKLTNKNLKLTLYKKNCNFFEFESKNIKKIVFSDTLKINKSVFVPIILEKISFDDKFVYITSSFSKVNFLKEKVFNYINLLSYFSYIKLINNFIIYFSKYFLITRKKVKKNIKHYKKLTLCDNKLKVSETIISIYENLNFSKTMDCHYFSPTSFIKKKEIAKYSHFKKYTFKKMGKFIFKRNYEYR